jgi:hypothetical protein
MRLIIPEVIAVLTAIAEPGCESRDGKGQHVLQLVTVERQIDRSRSPGMVARGTFDQSAAKFRIPRQ